MPLKPLRKLVKAYHGLVSPNKFKEKRPSEDIEHTETASVDLPENVSAPTDQHDGEVSVPLKVTDLPPEIFRCITDHLSTESLLVLRVTCQNFQHRIQLTSDQVSHAERLRCLILCANDSAYARDGWIVCQRCERIRPKTAFADSDLSKSDTHEVADCLRHSRIWVCPHKSYCHNELSRLATTHPSDAPPINETNRMCCELPQCDMWFSPKLHLDCVDPVQYSLHSSILVARIRPGAYDFRRAIALHFTKQRLPRVFAHMNVPICGHGLLNNLHMFTQLVRWNDEVEITDLRTPRKPKSKDRVYPRGFCSACEATGTKTEFRLNIVLTSEEARGTIIDLRVILTRSLGDLAKFDERGSHWRHHAMPLEKLGGFMRTWYYCISGPGSGYRRLLQFGGT